MSVRRRYLGLALLLITATAAVLAASRWFVLSPKWKYGSSQHMHGFELPSSIHLSASKLSGTSNHAAAG